ncbi:hypothetical protein VTO42DRAFT_1146 [Malbranchea cinnamomea]
MGRRPNPLVTEFFARGNKLPDSSNRYEHTCKLCGEIFPKGRADSLLSHLIKTCQAIPSADKERVIHQIRIDPTNAARKGQTNSRAECGKAASFPYPTARNGAFNNNNNIGPVNGLNGLNVLAEASRRVGASDGKQPADPVQDITLGEKNVIVDPALENLKHSVDTDFHAAFGQSPSTTQYFPTTAESALSMHLPPAPVPDTLTDARQSSQLSLIAASANEMVTQDGAGPLDVVDGVADFGSSFTGSTQRAALLPRPISINPSSSGDDLFSSPTEHIPPLKQRSRAPFSEERRKEVQYVRKLGACLRCRILKKTCSIDQPCKQCKNLQNPRVWSEYCIRDRLSTQLESYTAGLHSTLVYHETNKFKNNIHFEHAVGRIEITHFETDPPNILTFSVIHGRKPGASGCESHLPVPETHNDLDMQMHDVYLLDGDSEEWGTKLEYYMNEVTGKFCSTEPTRFVRETVTLASELRQTHGDDLLSDALQLWVATRLLVDPTLSWNIFYNPTLPPTTLHPLSTTSNEARTRIDRLNGFESFDLIRSQVRGAVEKRAAKIGKVLMNKVEERMLKRGSAGHFNTFLVTLILLNCAERMSWLFHTWDNDQSSHRWPLERRPSDFAGEAERFSGVVIMHLNMRKILSIYNIDAETGQFRAREGPDSTAAQWLNAVNITTHYLQQRQAAVFDPTDMRSFDLKYCSRLF